MYEKILVPLDGSEVGEAALPYVEGLVSKLVPAHAVEVTLFQVIAPSHYDIAGEASVSIPYTGKELGEIKNQAAGYLDKVGERLRNKGATVKTRVGVSRDAAGEILSAADEVKADLVAMSTHGRSGISRWAFGSVAERVLRAGTVPILTVRAKGETKQA